MSRLRSSYTGTDFTTGPIMPQMIRYFVPFLFSFLLNSLYNTVDTIIIGQFVGSTGIVAVAMGGKLLSLGSFIGAAVASGGQILIAQQSGAGKHKDIKETIGTLLSMLLILACFIGAISIIFSGVFLSWLNTPGESFHDARLYLIITSAGLPFMFGYNAVSSVLRGKGDSKNPLKYIAIASVFNVIGDVIFILVFHLGAMGTAIATVMGQAISLIFSLVELYRHRETFDFDFKLKSFRIVKDKLVRITKLGLPLAIRSFFIIATITVISGYVNLLGLTEAAVYAVGERILTLTNIFVYSANQSVSGMVGQNYGARKYDRIPRIILCAMAITLGTAIIMSLIGVLFPNAVFRCFTSDEGVMAYARSFMLIAIPNFILAAIQDPFDGFVTGTGKTLFSLIGGLLDGVVLRLGLTYLFVYGIGMGLNGFFLANACSRLGPLVVDMIVYFGGKWRVSEDIVTNT